LFVEFPEADFQSLLEMRGKLSALLEILLTVNLVNWGLVHRRLQVVAAVDAINQFPQHLAKGS
jgi:hypothetical protein